MIQDLPPEIRRQIERVKLHEDGLAFLSDVAATRADREVRLQEALRQQGVAEWRSFMREAPDEQELFSVPETEPFNGPRVKQAS
jgi:hypothetical protein